MRPGRSSGLDDNDSAELSDELQSEIRQAALDAIRDWLRGKPLALPRPSNARLADALSRNHRARCLKSRRYRCRWHVVRGGRPRSPPRLPPESRPSSLAAGYTVSVPASSFGSSALNILCSKRTEARRHLVRNRYPGCSINTPSLTYTFSCRPNDWSMHFPLREKIESYLLDTAQHFDLYQKGRFDALVKEARWDDAAGKWSVTVVTPDGVADTHRADYLFSAVGILNIPKYPVIEGLEGFAGEVYHTSRWPEDADLAGKRSPWSAMALPVCRSSRRLRMKLRS